MKRRSVYETFLCLLRWFWLRCRHPVMTLTPAALLLPGLAAPLECIEDRKSVV